MMKTLILILLFFPSVAFAHGYPTAEEFQIFPETFIAQPIATLGGVVVAVPFAVVGAVTGLVLTPFYQNDIGENVTSGMVFVGMAGYMVGQQIGWPFYGAEKGLQWILN